MEYKSNCYAVNLRRATGALTSVYDDYLEKTGLTFSQYCVMGNLERLGKGSVTEIADKCKLDRTTVVRLLKPLESRGFIVDEAQPGSRNRELTLSKDGQAIITEARKKWNEAQVDVEKALGKEDAEKLLELMEKLQQSYSGKEE